MSYGYAAVGLNLISSISVGGNQQQLDHRFHLSIPLRNTTCNSSYKLARYNVVAENLMMKPTCSDALLSAVGTGNNNDQVVVFACSHVLVSFVVPSRVQNLLRALLTSVSTVQVSDSNHVLFSSQPLVRAMTGYNN
jgi:hypothetical protein